jgi:hypothetical protein
VISSPGENSFVPEIETEISGLPDIYLVPAVAGYATKAERITRIKRNFSI